MSSFIELPVYQDEETLQECINIAHIGRIYPHPQTTRRSMMELCYHSINDAPVLLEIDLEYDKLKSLFL